MRANATTPSHAEAAITQTWCRELSRHFLFVLTLRSLPGFQTVFLPAELLLQKGCSFPLSVSIFATCLDPFLFILPAERQYHQGCSSTGFSALRLLWSHQHHWSPPRLDRSSTLIRSSKDRRDSTSRQRQQTCINSLPQRTSPFATRCRVRRAFARLHLAWRAIRDTLILLPSKHEFEIARIGNATDIRSVHVFFWYFNSRRDPATDDFTLWLNGQCFQRYRRLV